MILRNTLIGVLRDQRPPVVADPEIVRSINRQLPTGNTQHALVLTGLRRCGKSVLQAQLLRSQPGALYINFTLDQRDALSLEGVSVEVVPAWEWLDGAPVVNPATG